MAETTLDYSPGVVSVRAGTLAAVLAFLTVLPGDTLGIPLAALGTAAVGGGAVRGSRRLATGGATVLFLGVLTSAFTATDPFLPLLGGALAVVAWDTVEHGIGVGEHLGRRAATRRLEVTHAAASAIVGLVAVGVSYAVYTVAWGGLPVVALVLFVVAALLLTVGLDG
jgi:hypothetical protein